MFYTNGIIIQKDKGNPYKGIDGSGFSAESAENWYFNDDDDLSAEFETFYDEYIGRTYYIDPPKSFVSVCTDVGYIGKYIAESEKRGIKYRLLLCETEIPVPLFTVKIPDESIQFLGYDYAYSCGDNYSALYNEIPYVFPHYEKCLNKNGLFGNYDDIVKYISERDIFQRKFAENNRPFTLETGNFIIYKLYEIGKKYFSADHTQ